MIDKSICKSCVSVVVVHVGLVNGDEILVIDGEVVAELDLAYIESLLRDRCRLCVTVRSCPPDSSQLQPTHRSPGIAVFSDMIYEEYVQ